MFFLYGEYPRQVEPKLYIALAPFVGGFGDKRAFVHTAGIGKMQLEHVTAGFDVYSYRKRVSAHIMRKPVGHIEIIHDKSHVPAEFKTAAKAYRINIIFIGGIYNVAVHQRGADLQRNPVGKLTSHDYLVI